MSGVYHAGEVSVQKIAGVEAAAQQNSRIIRRDIPQGAGSFLRSLSLMIAASVDEAGRVWSSFLIGEPGFVDVEDEVTVIIKSHPAANDPLYRNLPANPEIGLLAIDLSRRTRMRINGTGFFSSDQEIVVKTEQVYGNCPKYIHKRTLSPHALFQRLQKSELRSAGLSCEQQNWIQHSDTFFIGSMSSDRKVDASHRGGPPGFIKVLDDRTLLFPDYFGNSMFNTLGNIYSNPSTGLLFIDFEYGHSLQLTGQSEIIWDETAFTDFPAAERLVRFEVNEVLFTENGTRLSWDFLEFSPFIPAALTNYGGDAHKTYREMRET